MMRFRMGQEDRRPHVSSFLFLGCLCLFGALVVTRATLLVTDPQRLGARGERRWFDWANREPYAAPALVQVADELRPGEPIVLVVPPTRRGLDWWRMIAAYHLPRHRVVGVFVGQLPRQRPDATRVRLRRDGSFRVTRSVAGGGG
jgi:hypothetical protein